MDVLFHTNRALLPDASGFRAVAGWWGNRAAMMFPQYPKTGPYLRTNASRKLKNKWNKPQSLKYEWALNASRSDQPFVLVDTDTIYQCTPNELLRRFESFGAPVVVGTERWWFPKPAALRVRADVDPWKTMCGPEQQRYPNSGLLMTTRIGLARLVNRLQAQPLFPCCSCWNPLAECFVDDQACLHAALLEMRLATWPACATGSRGRGRARQRRWTRHCHPTDHPMAPGGPAAMCSRRSDRLAPSNASTRLALPPGVVRGSPLPTRATRSGRDTYQVTHDDNGSADYALDVRSSLFLNMFMVTGATPCQST